MSFSPFTSNVRRPASAAAEAGPQRYRRTSDDFNRVLIELIISNVVLGEPALDLRAASLSAGRR
ncbi:hypothetical protein [Nocardia salmonicida]|uniref:hypothetical protein n=1 Tax=Nocardia salmonicida TaxID=53431 RepID=UPI003CE6C9B1